jgi:hypothetical protein
MPPLNQVGAIENGQPGSVALPTVPPTQLQDGKILMLGEFAPLTPGTWCDSQCVRSEKALGVWGAQAALGEQLDPVQVKNPLAAHAAERLTQSWPLLSTREVKIANAEFGTPTGRAVTCAVSVSDPKAPRLLDISMLMGADSW